MTVARPALEIAVTGPEGAAAARAGGADRVELCTGLELGGLTPSAAAIVRTVSVGLPVHVLVRCRPGDFRYSTDEVGLMAEDVRRALALGAAGVVVGALVAGGVDHEALRTLVAAARDDHPGAEVTFHRALDHLPHPAAHLDAVRALGVDRVLTSGGAAAAPAALPVLAAMAARTDGLQVMAGGGVTVASVPALVATGVHAVHLSAKRRAEPAPGPWVALGAAGTSPEDDTHFVTDATVIVAARAALGRPSGAQ